jgi:hypothetical protein
MFRRIKKISSRVGLFIIKIWQMPLEQTSP